MDIDSNWRHTETQTCYNCDKQGHISSHCPESKWEHVCTNLTQEDITGMISKSVTAALDACDASGKDEV